MPIHCHSTNPGILYILYYFYKNLQLPESSCTILLKHGVHLVIRYHRDVFSKCILLLLDLLCYYNKYILSCPLRYQLCILGNKRCDQVVQLTLFNLLPSMLSLQTHVNGHLFFYALTTTNK